MKIFVHDKNNCFLDFLSEKFHNEFKKKYKIIDIRKKHILKRERITTKYPVLVLVYYDKLDAIDLLNYCKESLKIIICSNDESLLNCVNRLPEVFIINTKTNKDIIYNKMLNYIVKFNSAKNG